MSKFAANTLLLIFSLFFLPGLPQVCEAVDIAFGDDFNDGEDDGWLHESGSWEVEDDDDGEFKYKGSNGRGLALVEDLDIQDCTIEADIEPITWGGDPYTALIVRYTEPGHYLAIWLHGSGVLLQEWGHDEHHTNHFDQGGMSHLEGNAYHLKAEVEGEHVTIWLDDVKITDEDYPVLVVPGKVGVSVADTPVAYFDNFEINGGMSVGATDPAGKLSGTWGRIKARL